MAAIARAHEDSAVTELKGSTNLVPAELKDHIPHLPLVIPKAWMQGLAEYIRICNLFGVSKNDNL